MSMPELPNQEQSFEQVLSEVIESIAAEESALSRIIEAETEKQQFALEYIKRGDGDIQKITELNNSAAALLQQLNDMQMILKNKLGIAVSRIPPSKCPEPPQSPPPMPPAPPAPCGCDTGEYEPYKCETCESAPCECESCKAKRYKAKQCGHEPCTCEKCKAKQCKGEPCNPTQSNPGAFNPELLMSMLKSQQQSPLFAMKEMLRFLQNPLPTLLRAFLFRRRRC